MLTINIHEYFKFQRNSNFPFLAENMKIARKLGNFAWMSFLHRGGEMLPVHKLISWFYFLRHSCCPDKKTSLNHLIMSPVFMILMSVCS